jgi:acetone carboxylase gamma subunit
MSLLEEKELSDLLDGTLDLERVREIQRAPKDLDRRERLLAIEQKRLGWKDRIVLALQESLFIVQTDAGKTVRCRCGHHFGDYRRNWKESALVHERDPQDGELYASANAPTKDWMILREFYCPSCATLLDTENVPQGYPFIFNFLPYFEDEKP